MSVILMTTLFYKALILQGEIWCWSLLELEGLSNTDHSDSARQSPVLWLERPIDLGGSHDEFESHLELGNLSAWAFGSGYISLSFKIVELLPRFSKRLRGWKF